MSTETTPTHLLLYTDGGNDTPRGFGGWGVHGYACNFDEPKAGIGLSNFIATKTGYAVGSGKGEVTVCWYVDHYGSLRDSTNNIAELAAAQGALDIVLEQQIPNVLLLMDSNYVLEGLSKFCPAWERNNWTKADGEPVKNCDQWKSLYDNFKTAKSLGINIQFRKVKGHSGDYGNDYVDRLATMAKEMIRNGNPANGKPQIFPAKGRWSTKSSRNRFLNCAHWFFNSDMNNRQSQDGRQIYHQSDLRNDLEYFGKPVTDATFSVVFLKEPDPVLEHIRTVTYELGNRKNFPVFAGHLREIFRPINYDQIVEHGASFLSQDFSRGRLFTSTQQLLVEELNPPGLAYRGIQSLNVLEMRLEEVLKPADGTRLRLTDITDKLIGSETVGKKTQYRLHKHIDTNTFAVKANVSYSKPGNEEGEAEVSFILGQDTPDRNTLNSVADEKTKIYAVTWPAGSGSFHYATAVVTEEQAGIWAGIYSNLRIVE